MADTTKTVNQVYLDLSLSKDNGATQVNRRVTFDCHNNNLLPDAKAAVRSQLIPSLVGGGLSTLIQPNGWRDYDEQEEEYSCINVEAGLISKTTTEFDFG